MDNIVLNSLSKVYPTMKSLQVVLINAPRWVYLSETLQRIPYRCVQVSDEGLEGIDKDLAQGTQINEIHLNFSE